MNKIIYFILAFLSITSCLTQKTDKGLQLVSPDPNEVAVINKESDSFMDGIYPVTSDSTTIYYTPEYQPNKSYYIDYRPVIVPKDFKFLKLNYDILDRPVISVELYETAHKTWYDATVKAYESNEPLFVIINNKVLMAPMINSPISGGRIQISGNLDREETLKIIDNIKEKYASPVKTKE